MNLITYEGLAMIDTDNVVQFQAKNDLHRMFAPGVIERHTRPGLLSRMWNRLSGSQQGALIFATSAAAVIGAFVWAVS